MVRGRRTHTLAVLAAVALVGSGCARAPEGAAQAVAVRCPEGSDCYDPPRAIGDGGEVAFTAVDFAYPEVTGAASQGDITVFLDNEANGEHNIVFVGSNEGSEDPITAGGNETAEGVVNLFTGDYTYFCSIPGHRASGMEGVLTVYATPEEAAEAAAIESDTSGGDAANESTDVSDDAAERGTEAETESSDGSLEDPNADSEPGGTSNVDPDTIDETESETESDA